MTAMPLGGGKTMTWEEEIEERFREFVTEFKCAVIVFSADHPTTGRAQVGTIVYGSREESLGLLRLATIREESTHRLRAAHDAAVYLAKEAEGEATADA